MFEYLSKNVHFERTMSVLDVGVTADRSHEFSNFFETKYPYVDRITALSDQDASWMEQRWPGLRFIRGNALQLPFEDSSFDLVFSSAVIEHVGSRSSQRKFLEELVRVSRKHVFITTPNRWFPMEPHSGLPFVHWLPARMFRWILRKAGEEYLSQEKNLNLLTRRELIDILPKIKSLRTRCRYLWFGGFPSNILLHMEVGA